MQVSNESQQISKLFTKNIFMLLVYHFSRVIIHLQCLGIRISCQCVNNSE